MPEQATTFAQFFSIEKELSGAQPEGEKSERKIDRMLSTLGTELKLATKFIKPEDLIKKVCEVCNIGIGGMLAGTWKKSDEIFKVLQDSAAHPEKILYIELVDHTIESKHTPALEIEIAELRIKKEIHFTITLAITIKALVLKLQRGTVTELQGGSCIASGSFSCEDFFTIKKESEPVTLPVTIELNSL